jgi:hypothetical protein
MGSGESNIFRLGIQTSPATGVDEWGVPCIPGAMLSAAIPNDIEI